VLSFLQRHKGLVVVGVLLLLPAVMLYAQTRRGGGRGPVVGALIDVAGLVERGLLWVSGGILDGIEHYVTSVGSYEELVRLRQERIAADVLQTQVAELSIENERLRGLANAAGSIDGPRPLGARVIGRTGRPMARLITIDKGSSDGLRRGDGVIADEGVVGVVLALGRGHADVLVLSDPASAIDVVVQRSRARGIIRGRGDDDKYAAVVEDFDRLRDVQPGDDLVTSGIGARFPPGLLVGRIVDVEDRDDLTLRAVVQPAVSLGRVEHVAVLIGRENPTAPLLGDDETVVPAPASRLRRSKRPKPDPLLGTGPAAADTGSASDVDLRDDGVDDAASGPSGADTQTLDPGPAGADAGVRGVPPAPTSPDVVPPSPSPTPSSVPVPSAATPPPDGEGQPP